MFKGIVITVMAVLSSAAARPEPQFFFAAAPYTALSAAYTAPAAPAVPTVPAVPAVPTVPAVPALPTYPASLSSVFSYAYQNLYSELPLLNPSANLVSAYNLPYSSLPYSSLPYSNLPYGSLTYAPSAAYLAYGK